MSKAPIARTTDIIVQELDGEVLVYDTRINKSFCLNETASAVWRACNGVASADEISHKSSIPAELVSVALADLEKEGLLEGTSGKDFAIDRITRRGMLMRAGAFAVALPVIFSLIAPTAAHAQSVCLPNGGTFDLTQSPFFADVNACVDALIMAAQTRCCSGSLNPAGGFVFGTNPQLCRGVCGPGIN